MRRAFGCDGGVHLRCRGRVLQHPDLHCTFLCACNQIIPLSAKLSSRCGVPPLPGAERGKDFSAPGKRFRAIPFIGLRCPRLQPPSSMGTGFSPPAPSRTRRVFLAYGGHEMGQQLSAVFLLAPGTLSTGLLVIRKPRPPFPGAEGGIGREGAAPPPCQRPPQNARRKALRESRAFKQALLSRKDATDCNPRRPWEPPCVSNVTKLDDGSWGAGGRFRAPPAGR